MLFRRFENLIDIFKPSPDVAPPAGMLRFYAHYLKQVWPLMTAVLVVGFFAAVIEVALFSFLGQLIDMAQATGDARTFFAAHRNELLWMAAVALVIRPLVFGLHNLLTHQAINPGLTNLIRWQNHRYVLKQSLNFFQNDFAGRLHRLAGAGLLAGGRAQPAAAGTDHRGAQGDGNRVSREPPAVRRRCPGAKPGHQLHLRDSLAAAGADGLRLWCGRLWALPVVRAQRGHAGKRAPVDVGAAQTIRRSAWPKKARR